MNEAPQQKNDVAVKVTESALFMRDGEKVTGEYRTDDNLKSVEWEGEPAQTIWGYLATLLGVKP